MKHTLGEWRHGKLTYRRLIILKSVVAKPGSSDWLSGSLQPELCGRLKEIHVPDDVILILKSVIEILNYLFEYRMSFVRILVIW